MCPPIPPTERELPARVRDVVEKTVGATVVRTTQVQGGNSPGITAGVETTAGRVFVKSIGPVGGSTGPDLYRREATIAATLSLTRIAPRLLGVDEGAVDGWVTLVYEFIDGHTPAVPWLPDDLDRVINALIDLATQLTPSPIPLRALPPSPFSPNRAATVETWRVLTTHGWRRLHQERPAALDPWATKHIQMLMGLEARAIPEVAGNSLLHLDLRADNILLTSHRVVILDWAHARLGAPWIDPVFFAPSVMMQGGPDPEDFITRHPAVRGTSPEAITMLVAAIAGFFTWEATQPPPDGMPHLRDLQAAQGNQARRWLAARLAR